MQSKSTASLLLAGAGNWGKNLARNFHALGALHTICDQNKDLLDTYRQTYPDISLSTSFSQALKHPAIDKVVIATPAAMHFSMAKEALLAGKDLFVEKPLCLDSAQAQELIDLAQQHGRILMVGHLLQYHPCVRRLQELVGSGELGKLQYITSNRLNLGHIRTEENSLWNFAPHDISVILSLCGHHLPEQIRCMGAVFLSAGIADTTMTTMRFPGNICAHIYVSWLHPFKEQKLIVTGTSAMAVFDDTQPWKDKLVIYRNPVTWKNGSHPQANKNIAEPIEVPQQEPLREECMHFLQCCLSRVPPKTDAHEGFRVLQVLQAAQESLNQEGEVQYPSKQKLKVSFFAHPTAIIDQQSSIDEGTKIWHFSHVMANAIIGKNCNIGQNVVVSPHVFLGCNVKVQNNVSIYTGVHCEDDVFLGPSVVFTNVVNPRSAIDRRGEYQPTWVRRGATLGANATIVCGVELGSYCFVGAGAVVTKNVKPHALVVGNPARQIGWMSRAGMRLDLPICLANDESRTVKCPSSGELYCLEGDALTPSQIR